MHISIHVLRVEDDELRIEPVQRTIYFNPRPPCGGRRTKPLDLPRARNFNPRPPCGGRPPATGWTHGTAAFQSTSSVWRTTNDAGFMQIPSWISIHVLRVEDDVKRYARAIHDKIFQSTSSVWRTTEAIAGRIAERAFQSTSSVWRTTGFFAAVHLDGAISIHVLRVEDDRSALWRSP